MSRKCENKLNKLVHKTNYQVTFVIQKRNNSLRELKTKQAARSKLQALRGRGASERVPGIEQPTIEDQVCLKSVQTGNKQS